MNSERYDKDLDRVENPPLLLRQLAEQIMFELGLAGFVTVDPSRKDFIINNIVRTMNWELNGKEGNRR